MTEFDYGRFIYLDIDTAWHLINIDGCIGTAVRDTDFTSFRDLRFAKIIYD
jgi:hypothetical protein